MSNLLFLGPTGSGKTRTVEAAAEILFGDSRAVNRILRNVIAMVRLAEARGVQLKASVPCTTITN